jgi:parallel beta-helix repeat protein
MTYPLLNATPHLDTHPLLHNVYVDAMAHFGAKADGTTDDTTALQAALDTGLNVFMPRTASYYKITSQLRMASSGQTLFGAGYRSRIHNATADSINILVGDAQPGDTAQYTGITIADLRLTQTLPHTTDDTGAIRMRSVLGGQILNCYFDSVAEAIQVIRRNAADARPEGCLVSGNWINQGTNARMGIELFAAKGCEVVNNIITSTNTTGLGIRMAGGMDNLVSGNIIRGTNSGISLQGGSGPTEGNLRAMVVRNRVVGLLGASAVAIVLFNDIQDALVEGNYLDDFVYGVWLKPDSAGGTDRIVVKNNRLRASASTTYCIFGGPPSGANDNDSVHVTDNYIDASAGANGIYFDNVAGRNYILRNTVILGSGDGINHANSAAATETVSQFNTIIGTGASQGTDNFGTGSGKFVNYGSDGVDNNTYQATSTEDVPLAVASPAQITANQNDYDPLFGSFRHVGTWRINSDAARSITGIAGGWPGRRLTLINVGGFAITLKNQDVGSVAGNRIVGTGAADVVLTADTAITNRVNLVYDDTTARWRVV